MDTWFKTSTNFNYQFSSSYNDVDLTLESLSPLDLPPPTGSLPNLQNGLADGFFVQRSAPRPIAQGPPGPTPMGRVNTTSSIGHQSADYAWSFSSSPPQGQEGMRAAQNYHVSPMLNPLSSTSLFFPELSETGGSNSSLSENLAGFSLAGSSMGTHGLQMPNIGMFGKDEDVSRLTEEELSSFFRSQEMLHAVAPSPALMAYDAAAHSYGEPMNMTPQVSPMLLPQGFCTHGQVHDGSAMHSSSFCSDASPVLRPQACRYDSVVTADLMPLSDTGSAQGSPELSPQDKSKSKMRGSSAEYGFVPMDMRHRLSLARTKSASKKTVGRRGPLTSETRVKAGKMRHIRACENCKRRKSSCDDGLYCRSCVRYYGVKLIISPCRGRVLSSLTEGFIHGGIFPTHRSLASFLGGAYKLTAQEFTVMLKIGFGPSMPVRIRAVVLPNRSTERLHHNHLMYKWPLEANQVTETRQCTHKVFPGVLSSTEEIKGMLDRHLANLVDNHFDDFPAYHSRLHVLPHFYNYYKKLPDCEARSLLQQAFKLLTLVHIGGDFHMSDQDPTSQRIVAEFFKSSSGAPEPNDFETCPRNMGKFPTPCFIRGQFGKVMPLLATELMADVLTRLEPISLEHKCEMWANACATFAVLLMATESIDYHAKKISFHTSLDPDRGESFPGFTNSFTFGPASLPDASKLDGSAKPRTASEEAFDMLLKFYNACFPNCHGQLSDNGAGRKRSNGVANAAAAIGQKDAQNTLIAELRAALRGAGSYLVEKKGDARRTSDDMSFFFDRKLARFFMMNLRIGS